MANYDRELEQRFYQTLNNFLKERNLQETYSILRQPNLFEYSQEVKSINPRPDFLIKRGQYPYIIVEIKASLNEYHKRKFAYDFFTTVFLELESIGADYFLVTDMELVSIFNAEGEVYDQLPLRAIFELFDQDLNDERIEELKQNIVDDLSIVLDSYKFSEKEENSIEATKEFLQQENLLSHLSFNKEGRFFHFYSDPLLGLQNFENRFFQTLLQPVSKQIVCRYTSFDSLYYMLNQRTYRMSSNVAMNDRGEIDYVDKYIGLYYKPLQSLSMPELQQMNRSFISSCTTVNKQDDLTMYRLYAEDTKGVCLCFDVANGLQSRNMLVKKISYADKTGRHIALDLIKDIITSLSTTYSIRFRFLYLDIWKHFFKTYDYAIEEEIRLLYLDDLVSPTTNQGWIITSPDKILSKYILFDLNDRNFPLTLNKIILGPNCPEESLNKRQLEVLLHEKGMLNIVVESSKIISYRKN